MCAQLSLPGINSISNLLFEAIYPHELEVRPSHAMLASPDIIDWKSSL